MISFNVSTWKFVVRGDEINGCVDEDKLDWNETCGLVGRIQNLGVHTGNIAMSTEVFIFVVRACAQKLTSPRNGLKVGTIIKPTTLL